MNYLKMAATINKENPSVFNIGKLFFHEVRRWRRAEEYTETHGHHFGEKKGGEKRVGEGEGGC